jgi:hypothetical protein
VTLKKLERASVQIFSGRTTEPVWFFKLWFEPRTSKDITVAPQGTMVPPPTLWPGVDLWPGNKKGWVSAKDSGQAYLLSKFWLRFNLFALALHVHYKKNYRAQKMVFTLGLPWAFLFKHQKIKFQIFKKKNLYIANCIYHDSANFQHEIPCYVGLTK